MKDNPDPQDHARLPPGSENKVLHAAFRIGETTLMASDGQCSGQAAFQGFGLSVEAANPAEAERLFKGLSAGGEVRLPLTKTFFSPSFGMVSDRFGVLWMVIVAQ
jgi:PhnB protein